MTTLFGLVAEKLLGQSLVLVGELKLTIPILPRELGVFCENFRDK